MEITIKIDDEQLNNLIEKFNLPREKTLKAIRERLEHALAEIAYDEAEAVVYESLDKKDKENTIEILNKLYEDLGHVWVEVKNDLFGDDPFETDDDYMAGYREGLRIARDNIMAYAEYLSKRGK